MEQSEHRIDTNAIIDYLGQKLPAIGIEFMNSVIDAGPNVSVTTKIELLGFNALDKHYQVLVDFINDASVLDPNRNVVEASIGIRKNQKTKLPDAIIAATAIVYGFKLVTRNKADFKNIPNLELVNPWEL